MDERIYSKNIIEFVTVSAEYCAFIERVPELEKEEFLDKSQKYYHCYIWKQHY